MCRAFKTVPNSTLGVLREIPVMDIEAAIAYVERKHVAEGCCREGRPAAEEVDASGKEERVRMGVIVREAHRTIVRKDFRLRVERA